MKMDDLHAAKRWYGRELLKKTLLFLSAWPEARKRLENVTIDDLLK